ncbi:hypothetical protein CKA56_02525 [Arcobacter venerupis]|uniref:autotransporter domain-containing protein n=1 Tax=Arcobacter venerupis TaxID=1054033 RepID=UPI000FEB89A1|nr:autotransporter domain-containing protein [Arcobacter venerupis]RWS50424.1 hypothetical protein CKA56_02525 [Arcobacter venerupis]
MNSFRVVDTRFRILKGGKIGLSLSIALITAMSTLGSINAYSETFFDGVTDGTTYTSGDVSARAKSDTGISSANYSSISTTENIIFKPDRVKSSYIGVNDFEPSGTSSVSQGTDGTISTTFMNKSDGTYLDINGDVTPNYDKLYYQTFTPSTAFTVTLDSGATVNNIIKQTSQYYSVNNTATYTIQNDSYTANLVFDGSNTVLGTTSIDDGNIKLNGSASFGGAVNAGSIDVDTTSNITFDSSVDLSAGTTDAMNFSQAGVVLLSDDFTGNVTSSSDNLGTLTVVGNSTGKEQIITGDIGTSTSSDINILNIGSNTVSSNYSKTVVNGNVFANSTVLNNNGTTNSSTLLLSDGSNITSTITTADSNMGILTLAGSSTVTGTVGSTGKLAEVNSGATGSTSTFTGTVNATNLTNTGTGTTTFKDDVTATTVNVNAGTTNFEKNLTATSTNITTGTGNFNTVSGSTNSNIVFSGAGTANLYGDLTGNIVTTSDNLGTVTFIGDGAGKAQTINGNIGSSITTDVNVLNIGESGVSSNYSTVTVNGDIFANSTVLNNNGTTNSSTLLLSDGSNITSTITTSDSNMGILTLAGTSTVNGQVGTDSNKLANVNAGANGKTATFTSDVYATNLNVTGTGAVDLNGSYKGTTLNYNADGSVNLADTKNITAAVTTTTNDTGTLNLLGTSTVNGQVGTDSNKLANVNAGANGKTATFTSDVYATNLNVTGTGAVDLNGSYKGTTLNYNADGSVNLADTKNITAAVTTTTNDTGTLNLLGTSTVNGQVGTDSNKLANVNAGANGKTATFTSDVYATSTNISSGEIKFESDLTSDVIALTSGAGVITFVGDTSGKTQTVTGNIGSSGNSINTLNIGDGGVGNYSKTVIDGNVYAANTVLNNDTTNNSTLELTDGSNITSTIKTSTDGQGILTFVGDSTATGTIGTDTEKLAQINAGADGKTVTFNSSINSNNLNITGDGTVVLADNANINAPISTTTNNEGTLTLNGTSTVSGDVGTSTKKLKEINAGVSGETVTFENAVNSTTLNVAAGTVNLNTVSGNTTSNIVFSDTGTVNLNGDLTGDINFSGNDAIVNVSDGKGILGSVQTLASNNTGILNYKGDGAISGNIGSSITNGIKELNINTNNEQNTPDGVIAGVVGLARELYADVVALENNATLTLLDNTNMLNSGLGSDKIFITTDVTNTGTLNFKGTSNITGQVGESNKVLNTINAGVTGETVTFNDMVYATTLKYSDNGTVVLNGNTTTDTSEGIIGTVDLNNTTGTLEIGDDVNLTTGTSGIQFANANDAILKFTGNSTITGVLGGNTTGNSTFERIYAGADGSTVTFKNDVYVEESNDTTLHVSGTGTVNFEGNLTGDLIYDADGTVNVSDAKSIIVSTVPTAVRTQTDNTGTLNFLGTTTLYSDIGTETKKLKDVTFALEGTSSDTYTQTINKNIYAQNTYIGNGSNSVTVNVSDDIIFGGNLDLKDNTTLNVSDNDITVKDTLTMASNSKINFKVYTTDLSAGQAVENADSGSITSNSLTMASDAKINIDYVGSWYGAGKYNLITSSSVSGTYYGTEANGLVSDNSIIDSIVKIDGTNLTLFADRTGGGSYDADDLYIVKSEIGDHYSNGASQALAGYANEANREGALADIIRDLEELQGGTTLSADKKAEMIKTQKLLAPVANNSGIQSTIIASNLVLSTIKDRMSDVRGSTSMDFIPYSGYSSGDYGLDNSLWIKALASKATQSKVKDYDGYDSKSTGFVAGYDRTLKDGTTVGVALAHSNTQIDQADFRKGDTSETKSTQLTIYTEQEFGDAYIDGLLSYAKHSTDATRTANSGQLSSSVDAEQLSAKIELGYRVYFEDIATLTPFTSIEYGTLNQKAYTEKGTKYQNDALKVDSVKMNKGTVGVGAKLTTNLNLGDALIIPELRLAVYNSIGDTNADIKAQYVGGGNQFVTPTEDLNKTIYNAGAGLNTTLSDSSSLIFGVDYDRSKDGKFVGYSGNVSFKLSF